MVVIIHSFYCLDSLYEAILDAAPDATARSRLLAATKKESGAWLHALPMSSLELHMDDDIIRIAVGLRLGVTLTRPHRCRLCGAESGHARSQLSKGFGTPPLPRCNQ